MMTKPELLDEINRIKEQIRTKKNQLTKEEQTLTDIEDFQGRSNSRINSFSSSITKRRKKLINFDGFLSTVKIAARYKQKMNDMLSGYEYQNAVNQIDSLQNSISTEKTRVKNRIISLKDDISYLQRKLQQLQYDYNNYPEEVEANG